MWIRSYSKVTKEVSKESIFKAWSDFQSWHKWNPGVEYARIDGPVAKGNHFFLKPAGMKEVKIELHEMIPNQSFTDCTVFPGCKMYGMHEIEETKDGIKLTTTMKVEGWLKYVWIFLVARHIVAKIPEQTDKLIEYAKRNNKS